jgi:hypothetical protein
MRVFSLALLLTGCTTAPPPWEPATGSSWGMTTVSICDLGDDYQAACPVTTTYFEFGECDDTACTDEELDLISASVECDLAQEDPCAVNAACEVEYAASAVVSMECLFGLAGLDGLSTGSTWTTTTTTSYLIRNPMEPRRPILTGRK